MSFECSTVYKYLNEINNRRKIKLVTNYLENFRTQNFSILSRCMIVLAYFDATKMKYK